MIVDYASTTYPGKLLVNNTQDMIPGDGTHIYLGKVYASTSGTVKILPAMTGDN